MSISGVRERIDVEAVVREVVARLASAGATKGCASPASLATGVSPKPSVVPKPVASTKPAVNQDSPILEPGEGVFPGVDSAVSAAAAAQRELMKRPLADRETVVEIIKAMCEEKAEEWGKMEYEESRIGRPDHKAAKLKLVRKVLGVEALKTDARGDTSGIALVSAAPWGVIGMVTPATHSVPTMAGNAINVIAAGNTAVFSPHPAAARCLGRALSAFNREIARKTGLANLLCVMRRPSIESAGEMFVHRGISLLCVTGGPAVVKAAMKSGKRVIAAGPGNPPVVVDETADLAKAARDIIEGAAFDNNLLCIAEKEAFVVASVADAFMAAMSKAGAFLLDGARIERLAGAVLAIDPATGHVHPRREFVGASAKELGDAAGVGVPDGVDLLFGETRADHGFVVAEQMMPFLPVVRAGNVDEAIEMAAKAEHRFRHTAVIHSKNMDAVTRMAKRLNTTLFVHNAPCTAALGVGGPGYLSYSIATPTGEGVTTPLTFTRARSIVIGGGALDYL